MKPAAGLGMLLSKSERRPWPRAVRLALLAAAVAAGGEGVAAGAGGGAGALAPGGPALAAPASTAAGADPLPADTALLAARRLTLPVAGVRAEALANTFRDARNAGRVHDAIDIMAAAGTPVLAVEAGRVAKLFFSKGGGGITIYQFDPSERYSYYYAHLQRYADGLAEGQQLRRGDVIGYVGSTGNASPEAPHLHFAIARLPADKAWWKGEAINPYPVLRGTAP